MMSKKEMDERGLTELERILVRINEHLGRSDLTAADRRHLQGLRAKLRCLNQRVLQFEQQYSEDRVIRKIGERQNAEADVRRATRKAQ